MTRDQWNLCAVALDHLWPGDFLEADSAAYFMVLGEYDYQPIETAIKRLATRSEWRPSCYQIVKAAGVQNRVDARERWQAQIAATARIHGARWAIEAHDPKGTASAYYPPEVVEQLAIGAGK